MKPMTAEQPNAVLLERIDAIIDELQALRQTVLAMQSKPADINLTQLVDTVLGAILPVPISDQRDSRT